MSITLPAHAGTQPVEQRPRVTRDQQLLAEVEAVYRRYMYFPHEHAYTIATLWAVHTHLRSSEGDFLPYVTPRIYFGSMGPGCGKTLALELTTLMSFRGEMTLNPTEPGLVSMFHNDKQTVGLTEIDKFFGDRGGSKDGHKAVINGGYKRGATVSRERGGVTEKRRIHGPMALDGKNAKRFLEPDGPFDAVRSRSIAVILEKKGDRVQLAEYDPQRDEARLRAIGGRLATWGVRNAPRILAANVDRLVPAGIVDRDRETWRVLFQVAAFVGGEWPERIQAAARALVLNQWGEDETPVLSPAQELLSAAQGVYRPGEDFLRVSELITRLRDVKGWWNEDWRSVRGAEMSLADELATFRIESTRAYVDTDEGRRQKRGYAIVDLLVEIDEPDDEPVTEDVWDDSELDALDDE